MALKKVRIGSLVDIGQYDDGDYSSAIETDQPIAAGTPVDPDHVVRLTDLTGVGTNFSLGSFTRDTATASGQQTVNGVGFTPSSVIFMANVTQTTEISFGIDNGNISGKCFSDDSPATADTWRYDSQYSIYLLQAAGIYYAGRVNAFNSDGFVMDWWKNGAKVGTANIFFLALG